MPASAPYDKHIRAIMNANQNHIAQCNLAEQNYAKKLKLIDAESKAGLSLSDCFKDKIAAHQERLVAYRRAEVTLRAAIAAADATLKSANNSRFNAGTWTISRFVRNLMSAA